PRGRRVIVEMRLHHGDRHAGDGELSAERDRATDPGLVTATVEPAAGALDATEEGTVHPEVSDQRSAMEALQIGLPYQGIDLLWTAETELDHLDAVGITPTHPRGEGGQAIDIAGACHAAIDLGEEADVRLLGTYRCFDPIDRAQPLGVPEHHACGARDLLASRPR